MPGLGEALERLYLRYNSKDFVEPDPLQFLYRYPSLPDREIAGLVASGLAYGRVEQILKSVARVLDCIGPEPSRFLCGGVSGEPVGGYSCYRHRFSCGEEIFAVAGAAARIQKALGGSLLEAFSGGDMITRQRSFVATVLREAGLGRSTLLPEPSLGSACKRLNLYLRWMVRNDEVDPGGWGPRMAASELMVPLDVHMHRTGLLLGLTRRRQADIRTVREITEGFAALRPDDPVRYDFALTRFGIRRDLTPAALLEELELGPGDA